MAPADLLSSNKSSFGNKYEEYKELSEKLVKEGKGDQIVNIDNYRVSPTARTFYEDYIDNETNKFFNYCNEEEQSQILSEIKIPVLVIVGENDTCVYTTDKEKVHKILKENISDLTLTIIANTGHTYKNMRKEMIDAIRNGLKVINLDEEL